MAWGRSKRKKGTPTLRSPVAPSPVPVCADGNHGPLDPFLANGANVKFTTPQEAVQALVICKDEEVSRQAFEKELALTLSPESSSSQVQCTNRLMYNLQRRFLDNDFLDGFVAEGGVDALLTFARVAEGSLEGEAYRTVRNFCRTPRVAECTCQGCLVQIHAVIGRISREHSEDHVWGKAVRHAFETLSEIVYRSPAEVSDRIHDVFAATAVHYACIDEVLRRSGTRLLYITATAVCFLLLLCTSATRARATQMVALWKMVHLPRTLLRLLDEMGDDSTKALIQLLLFTIGCPARVSLLPHHGREVGEFTRFLYKGKGRLRLPHPPVRHADPKASAPIPSDGLCMEYMDAVKEVAFNALPDEPSSPSSAQDGTLKSLVAAETLARWRTLQVYDETRGFITSDCISGEIGLLEAELPNDSQLYDADLRDETQIGGGSFGKVYRATNGRTMEEVAVKYPKTVENEPALKKLKRSRAFLREALMLHRLRNNGIVNFYGWGKSEDDEAGVPRHWYVTECCEGNLAHSVLSLPLTAAQRGQIALRVGQAIASALSYLHSRTPRMVHLDVAARNVLVAANGGYKLGDVGSSRYEGEWIDLDLAVPWSPPEALRKGYVARQPHDVWAFGCLLYEVLEGNIPYHYLLSEQTLERSFPSLVKDEVLADIIPAPPFSVAEEDPLAQDIWDDVISHCWAHRAAARPPIADMLVQFNQLASASQAASSLSGSDDTASLPLYAGFSDNNYARYSR